jgi:hypothetical protein
MYESKCDYKSVFKSVKIKAQNQFFVSLAGSPAKLVTLNFPDSKSLQVSAYGHRVVLFKI